MSALSTTCGEERAEGGDGVPRQSREVGGDDCIKGKLQRHAWP